MKKTVALASAILIAGGIVFPTAAAQAACANYAIWTFDGDAGNVQRWSTSGKLLSTVDTTINSPDMALSSDLTKFLAIDNGDGELKAYNSSTGDFISSNPITGPFSSGGAGAGVVASGNLLTDSNNLIYSINLSMYVSTEWADLSNADSDLPVGERGSDWDVAGDILQLPDGDVLVLGVRDSNYDLVYVLRVNPASTTDIDIVGTIDASTMTDVWGAARAGDNIYIATESGALYKLASVPTAVSTNPVSLTSVTTAGGSFWGAAGSNDSTDGSATCNGTPSVAIAEGLAPTGSSENIGIIAGVLAFATAVGGAAIRRRRSA